MSFWLVMIPFHHKPARGLDHCHSIALRRSHTHQHRVPHTASVTNQLSAQSSETTPAHERNLKQVQMNADYRLEEARRASCCQPCRAPAPACATAVATLVFSILPPPLLTKLGCPPHPQLHQHELHGDESLDTVIQPHARPGLDITVYAAQKLRFFK